MLKILGNALTFMLICLSDENAIIALITGNVKIASGAGTPQFLPGELDKCVTWND